MNGYHCWLVHPSYTAGALPCQYRASRFENEMRLVSRTECFQVKLLKIGSDRNFWRGIDFLRTIGGFREEERCETF